MTDKEIYLNLLRNEVVPTLLDFFEMKYIQFSKIIRSEQHGATLHDDISVRDY